MKQPLTHPTLLVTGLELEAPHVGPFSRMKKTKHVCLETMDCLLRSKTPLCKHIQKIIFLKSCVEWSLGDFLGLKMELPSIA